jgi:hypothetical protein
MPAVLVRVDDLVLVPVLLLASGVRVLVDVLEGVRLSVLHPIGVGVLGPRERPRHRDAAIVSRIGARASKRPCTHEEAVR